MVADDAWWRLMAARDHSLVESRLVESELVDAPLAKTTARWFTGWIAPEVSALVLRDRGVAWQEVTKGGEGQSSRGRRSKKRGRAVEVPLHQVTWVACDACGKWRRLPPGTPAPPADERWRCEDNAGDPARRACRVAEEPW